MSERQKSKIVDKVKADPENFSKSKAFEDLMKENRVVKKSMLYFQIITDKKRESKS